MSSSASICATEAMCFSMKSRTSPGTYWAAMSWADVACAKSGCLNSADSAIVLAEDGGRIRLLRIRSACKFGMSGTNLCGLSQRSGCFHLCLHTLRFAFILVGQGLKRSGKLWFGCADCQAPAIIGPFLQLFASRWLNQLTVGSPHRRTPRSLTCLALRRRRILERNKMRARQEKPVRLSSIRRFRH